eukprot:sb/3476398/
MLRYLPSAEEMGNLRQLKGEYDDLCPAEQFAFVLSNIPRVEPRLQAMVFRKKFEEELKELTPDIANVMAACEEVRESEKFAKTLEVRENSQYQILFTGGPPHPKEIEITMHGARNIV